MTSDLLSVAKRTVEHQAHLALNSQLAAHTVNLLHDASLNFHKKWELQ